MLCLLPFARFDPLTGTAPTYFARAFISIVDRSREILEGRRLEEIRFAYQTIEWILPGRHETGLSPALALQGRTGYFDLEGQERFPGASWSEYFAILTLALVGETFHAPLWLRLKGLPPSIDEERLEKERVYFVGCLAIDAMEAIGLAEHFSQLPSQGGSEGIPLRSQSETIQNHGAALQLKGEFVDFYFQKSFPNKSQAAHRFCEALSPQERDLLAPINPVKELVEALNTWQKESEWL